LKGIQIALEHEISKRRTEDFLKEEIQRLIDIKARYKIGIFYPMIRQNIEMLKKSVYRKGLLNKKSKKPIIEQLKNSE